MKPALTKFLTGFWGIASEDLKDEMIENDHYIAWYCGIDHIVNRDKTPESVIIVKDFETYSFNKLSKSKDIMIKYSNKVKFFYNHLKDFIDIYFEGKPFEMRIIKIPNGFSYLEFKLDDNYSFVVQMIYNISEEEMEELRELNFTTEMPKEVEFDDIFKKITIGDDMIL